MTVTAVRAPGIDEIAAAAGRIASYVTPLPLVRLLHDHGDREIHLQLENLQPVGCYKLRGAANAMLRLGRDVLDRGLYVASAGNLAQGCAWMARELGTSLRVLVPQDAPETKLAAVRRLGGEVVRIPVPAWWQTMITAGHPAASGHFIHGVFDSDV
ncbi:MAG: pyridoxal-phosphate dependent enzyme, partial [Gammaproteobacteria bacterium]